MKKIGQIKKIFPEKHYGFIQTGSKTNAYFRLNDCLEFIKVGDLVIYSEEIKNGKPRAIEIRKLK